MPYAVDNIPVRKKILVIINYKYKMQIDSDEWFAGSDVPAD